jgi:hypothetical protein
VCIDHEASRHDDRHRKPIGGARSRHRPIPRATPKNVARDVHRHPRETLGFFQACSRRHDHGRDQPERWLVQRRSSPRTCAKAGTYVAAIVDPAALPEAGRDSGGGRSDNARCRRSSRPRRRSSTACNGAAYDPARHRCWARRVPPTWC